MIKLDNLSKSSKVTFTRYLKNSIITSGMLALISCSQPNISTTPSVQPEVTASTTTLNKTMKITSLTESYLRRLAAYDVSEKVSFITDCAGNSSFKISGQVEGEPCESDSFSGMQNFYIPPEYNKTSSVMVSGYLGEIEGGTDIIKGILQTGSAVWYLTADIMRFNKLKTKIGATDNENLINLNVVTSTIWSRDWSPLMSKPSASFTGTGFDLKMVDTNYYPERPVDNSISRQIQSNNLKSDTTKLNRDIKRTSLPVYMEGGNIMCNENNCFLTRKVLEKNQIKSLDGDITLDENAIKSEFKKQIEQDIWFVPAIPYEGTKHIDMWSKFLNKDTLIIGSISDETINTGDKNNNSMYKEIQQFLDDMATGKDKTGREITNSLAYLAKKQNPNLKIIRIPMPLPGFYKDEHSGQTMNVFRSYTNSLLLNGYALVPQYSNDYYMDQPYEDNSLKDKYENDVKSIYEQAGYKVIWIPSDTLIGNGGAVHCVTMQVPA